MGEHNSTTLAHDFTIKMTYLDFPNFRSLTVSDWIESVTKTWYTLMWHWYL